MNSEPLPTWRSLSGRIIGLSFIALVLGLLMMGGTLWLSWQMEGAAAAINDAGSLRMKAYRLALAMSSEASGESYDLNAEIQAIDKTLVELSVGDPIRPLVTPDDAKVRFSLMTVKTQWQQKMKPLAIQYLNSGDVFSKADISHSYRALLEGYVAEIQNLVHFLEYDNANKTEWLRSYQLFLIGFAIAGTVAIVYLLYLWIIHPLLNLQKAIGRMALRQFDVTVQIESKDEFGQLGQAFNHMASELKGLYESLEQRVEVKTRALTVKNLELDTLYRFSSFFNHAHTQESLCQGFLERIVHDFQADGGSVRMYYERGDMLQLVCSIGYSDEMESSEFCMHINDCLCGDATKSASPTYVRFQKSSSGIDLVDVHCQKMGFKQSSMFQITYQSEVLGLVTLHFKRTVPINTEQQRLLKNLAQHLGTTIQTVRTADQARELAIAQERSIVARGLHDSIAQSISFLNIQVQLLQESIKHKDWKEVEDIVPQLKTGVQESYDDVRELLTDFRSKLDQSGIDNSIRTAIERFKLQTKIPVRLKISNHGPELPRDQQLQVLFILQEALSNIRKHAQAKSIEIELDNEKDFILRICDDGVGFDIVGYSDPTLTHVGLNIMRERAQKVDGELSLTSSREHGTQIKLVLPQSKRHVA